MSALLSNVKKFNKFMPSLKIEMYRQEKSFLVKKEELLSKLKSIKSHFRTQLKILSCISGVDYPEYKNRFQVVYDFLSARFNGRLRLKIMTNEIIPVDTAEKIFPAASWYESEVWDMFGVFFLRQYNLTRILTDYGIQDFPLRKDFPLSGFSEMRFNVKKNGVRYENLELAQEYRTFNTFEPWENLIKPLVNEKAARTG